MVLDRAALVGRERELATLCEAFAQTKQHQGSVWFLSGEPGIGKSRLAEEAARRAAALDLIPLWGRSWEAGGAPAYWPFVQVLRTLLRGRDREQVHTWLSARAGKLQQILPEFGDGDAAPNSSDPERARFLLWDAVASLLIEAAERTPLLIVLEDLHAADLATVTLLEFLAGQIANTRIAVLGTFRSTEVFGSKGGAALMRLSLQARTLDVTRLGEADALAVVEQLTEGGVTPDVLQRIARTTEGHPLFLSEMCRWLAVTGCQPNSHAGISVPQSLRTTIRDRLRSLPVEVRGLLECAAVIGHEFELPPLNALSELEGAEQREALRVSVTAAVLVEVLPGSYRFAHILFREVLHQDLDAERSAALHRALAEFFLSSSEHQERVLWSEVAHHLLLSGPEARGQASEAAEHAATACLEQYAFDEARSWYEHALAAQQAGSTRDAAYERRRCQLLLGRGQAEIRAGQHARGQKTCLAAADIAKALNDAELLALAALEYGQVYVFGLVDSQLVGLLRDALQMLPEGDSVLRARVQARLAAALQPAPDPSEPIAMALDAVAMARRLGDPLHLLLTIKSAGSALMDLSHPSERIPLNIEHAQLAEQLADGAEAVRAEMRLSFDYFELGDFVAAHAALRAAASKTEALDDAHFRWRTLGLEAMVAIWEGRFEEARELREQARQESERAGDPNGPRCLAVQKFAMHWLLGEGVVSELVEELAEKLDDGLLWRTMRCLYPAQLSVRLGQPEKLVALNLVEAARTALHFGDLWLLEMVADVAEHLPDRKVVQEVYDKLFTAKDRFVSGGLAAMVWERPVVRALAAVSVALGHGEQADAFYREAFEKLEGKSDPQRAWTALEWARFRLRTNQSDPLAKKLLQWALDAAERCSMPGLRWQLEQALGQTPESERVPSDRPRSVGVPDARFRLQRKGEMWTVEHAGRIYQLKDTKGLRWMARLIEEPGREFFVLDLVHDGASADVDGGDAGPVLDDAARQAYRSRLSALQAELAEAEEWNDAERAARAREEIEALGQQLSAAVGLGGRSRRTGSALEKARINVQRRIKDAIQRIDKQDAELARHLSWAIRTGTYCSYQC